MHFMGESQPCVAFFFSITQWSGHITNKEPHKHTALIWCNLTQLPEKLIPRHRKALELSQHNTTYSEDNWLFLTAAATNSASG
jgi:hypothetical protein